VPSKSPDSSTPSRRKFSAFSEFLTPTIASRKQKVRLKHLVELVCWQVMISLLCCRRRKRERGKAEEKPWARGKCTPKEIERKRRNRNKLRKKKAQELEEKQTKGTETKRENKPGAARRYGETSRSECGLQSCESTSTICIVCFGDYNYDWDGTLIREWVRWTNNDYQKWMHEDLCQRK